ncbi:MAG: hypothetical protein NTX82_04035 [Candidatus Parcubacteria bacterium]|nr:hypothetical protein [Candidatus Parcubacteria bacterium]
MKKTTVLIVISILSFLTLTVAIIFRQQIALLLIIPYIVSKLKAHGVDENWAYAASLPIAFAVLYTGSQLISFDKQKNLIGTICACVLWVGWFGTIAYSQRDYNWDPNTGEAIKCYAPTPFGYETLSCQFKIHPKYGTPVSQVTPEIAIIEATKDGAILPINKVVPKCDMTYFTVDGQPVYWIYRQKDGTLDVFNHPGRHPQFNTDLSPISGEIVTEICQKEKEAQLAAEQKKAEELKLQNAAVQPGQTVPPQPATGSTQSQQTPATTPKEKPEQATSTRDGFSCPQGQQEYITTNEDPRERLKCCVTADNKLYLADCQLADQPGFCTFIMKNGEPVNYPENSCRNGSDQMNYGFTIINHQARFWGCPDSWSPTGDEGCCYQRVIPVPPVQCGFMLAGSAANKSDTKPAQTYQVFRTHYSRPIAGPEAITRPPTQTLYWCPTGQLPLVKPFPNCCLTADGNEICELEEPFATGKDDDPQATNFIEFQFHEEVTEFYVTFYEAESERKQLFTPRHNVMFLFIKKGVYYVNFRAEKGNWLIDGSTKVNFPMAYRINYGSWVLISSANVEQANPTTPWNVRIDIP